jgi:uncharacterized protein (TIGR00369 family)
MTERPETMMEALGIEVTGISGEQVVATMPVHGPTRQPFGMLHGGASVALAETVASIGTYHLVGEEEKVGVGMEINANHLRSKGEGAVTATGVPLHRGRSTMVWDVRIMDEEERLVCVSRCTVAVLEKKG